MDALETLHAFEEACTVGDLEKADMYLADSYELDSVASGVHLKGKAAVKAFIDRVVDAFPDLKFEGKSAMVSGNKVVWEYVMSGTQKKEFRGMPATGKSFSLRCCSILEFEGGVFTKETAYLDVATMMRQLGHLPSPT
jgi:steroid delta-isomerase-like uncharacterized protein